MAKKKRMPRPKIMRSYTKRRPAGVSGGAHASLSNISEITNRNKDTIVIRQGNIQGDVSLKNTNYYKTTPSKLLDQLDADPKTDGRG